ncbi:aminoacyltransferase [Staphylococcus canis]|uniref:Aminoacyltransferase n=1 Tax=Staphylococcus canis TaxID=2724942 RepID=A0ABS0T9L9_9STAP|nr:aminoacyltransferase [Staphylococcus canis]MBI5974473.1 aminoacyltransferase [Staphylococcus canis]
MYFTELTKDEYQSFIQSHPSQYTQSIQHFNYRQQAQQSVALLGVKDEMNRVIAAGLFTMAPVMKFFNYAYSHRGPVMDYRNIELVDFYFKSLTDYLWRQKTIFVLVDPYIIEHIRNHHGEIVSSYNHNAMVSCLEKLGYRHQGFSVGYGKMSQARWLSVLNLEGQTESELLANMDYNTSRGIRKSIDMGVKVRDLTPDEFDIFYSLYQMAEQKHNFSLFSKDDLKRFLSTYEGMSHLKVAYLDLDEHLDHLKNELEAAEAKRKRLQDAVDQAPSKKKRNVLKDQEIIVSSIQKRQKEAEHLYQQHGKTLYLASAIFVETEHELTYMYSGSNPQFNRYMGNYALQWAMIQYALSQNIPRYNFFGITGDFTPEAQDYGVLDFKKGFGGHVEELIGDFIKPVHPLLYQLYRLRS